MTNSRNKTKYICDLLKEINKVNHDIIYLITKVNNHEKFTNQTSTISDSKSKKTKYKNNSRDGFIEPNFR